MPETPHTLVYVEDDPATAHIPVIALSANAMPLNVKSGLEAGFFRYLTKPIVLEGLTNALDRALAFADALAAKKKATVVPAA